MVGRKRKIGVKREVNGRAQRAYENPRRQVASQPHRMAVKPDFREDPRASTAFGRLMLNGYVTPAQYEAGDRYGEISAKLRAVYDAASPHPRAIDLNRTGGGTGVPMTTETAEAIKEKYKKAFEAVSNAGTRAARAVKDCIVLDKFPESIQQLRCGLNLLVIHYGIDPRLQISLRQ